MAAGRGLEELVKPLSSRSPEWQERKQGEQHAEILRRSIHLETKPVDVQEFLRRLHPPPKPVEQRTSAAVTPARSCMVAGDHPLTGATFFGVDLRCSAPERLSVEPTSLTKRAGGGSGSSPKASSAAFARLHQHQTGVSRKEKQQQIRAHKQSPEPVAAVRVRGREKATAEEAEPPEPAPVEAAAARAEATVASESHRLGAEEAEFMREAYNDIAAPSVAEALGLSSESDDEEEKEDEPEQLEEAVSDLFRQVADVQADVQAALQDRQRLDVEKVMDAEGDFAMLTTLLGGPAAEPVPPEAGSGSESDGGTVTIVVPNGLKGGDTISVEIGGGEIDVEIPEGLASGDELEVEVGGSETDDD